jgi:hypothetical protein
MLTFSRRAAFITSRFDSEGFDSFVRMDFEVSNPGPLLSDIFWRRV